VSVTKLACEGCGAQLEQPSTGRRRHTCSSPCRQRAYRRRVSARGESKDPGQEPFRQPFRLTAETRAALRRAIDQRRRELLVAPKATAADRALFADERVVA
jgi:hypothetical protein